MGATGGDKLFCMDIKSAPAVNEAPMVTATNMSILEGVDCSRAACQKDCGCGMDKCAASIQTCLADKTCAKGQDCVMNCACGDKHCAMKCARAHPSRKGMAVAMCLANNCESDMGTAAMDEFVAQPQASASQLKLAWNDCGDSSTHTKITSFSPSTITTGQTATMAGTGNLDEDVSGATFDLEMNTLAGKVSCKGDASQSKTCHLPLGVGSLTFNAMSFPIKKGSTTVSVDLSLSAMLPGALAHTETKVTATATGGDKLFCVDIKSAPGADEFISQPSLMLPASVPPVVSAASGAELKLTWSDCGDSSTHTKITGFTPSTITTGQKATMTGTGNLDEGVSGATFDLEMKTAAGTVSCKGDASQSKTCNLPLGTGSLTFDAMAFPIKKGSTSVNVDLALSAMLPGALAHTETKVTAIAAGGDKLFCVDIKSAPGADEL